jgi:hypothetical protein
MLLDKKRKRGRARVKRWHDGRHVHGMVMKLLSPCFNHQEIVLGLMQETQRNNDQLRTKEV